MNRVRLARPVRPSCEAWNATCSAISHRSIARPTMLGQLVELLQLLAAEVRHVGADLDGERVGGAAVGAHVIRVVLSASLRAVSSSHESSTGRRRPTPGSGPPRCRRWSGAPPSRHRPARRRGAAAGRPRPWSRRRRPVRPWPGGTPRPPCRLRKTRTKDGSTRAIRNRTPMTTVSASVTRPRSSRGARAPPPRPAPRGRPPPRPAAASGTPRSVARRRPAMKRRTTT